jgi:sulfide:quinone oxidoreductase
MTLLDESRVNHAGKKAFPWVYWNLLLPGRHLPLPTDMSMAGKHDPTHDHTHSTTEEPS